MPLIKPTPGRVVWFYPSKNSGSTNFCTAGDDTPLAAIVARVWGDTCVNLTVFDANGVPHSMCSVPLIQEGAPVPEGGYYAAWMPYQLGQAKKAEPAAATEAPATEQAIEAEIQAKGLTAPRIAPDQIAALMARVEYRFEVPEGTTSTFAHAFLDGKFHLATGHSACVSPENFNALIGQKIAKSNAEAAARDKLWELEGYALFKRLAGA